MSKNLTSGTPGLVILAFAIPLVIGNVFQQLYSMADAFVVSQEIGIAGLAAITSTGSLQFLVLGFLMGVTSGASIITAQRCGAVDEGGMRRSFAASIVICGVVSIVLMAISILTLRPLLKLLNTPPEIFEDTYKYFVVLLWGMPTILLFNLLSNVMRAAGDSKTPLYFLIAACVINIILDYVFIRFFEMGVIGAGFATVIAELISGLLCIPAILKKLPALRITKEDWKLPVSEYIDHIKIALPVGFQWSIIAIGAVAVSFSLNGLGYEAVAAFNIGQRIDQFAGMPLSSYGQALTTFVAQNYGAKKYARIRVGALQGCVISSSFTVVMGVIFIVFGDYISRIFLKGNDGAVLLAHKYLIIVGAFFILLAFLYTCRQVVQGIGNAMIPTVSGVFELFMRSFAALFLTRYFGYTGLCFASPLAFAGALIPLSIGLVIVLKRIKLLELSEKRT